MRQCSTASARAEPSRACARGVCGSGWLEQSGDAQPWESAFFFGDSDMISDELSDADLARYDRAKETGDAAAVMDSRLFWEWL